MRLAAQVVYPVLLTTVALTGKLLVLCSGLGLSALRKPELGLLLLLALPLALLGRRAILPAALLLSLAGGLLGLVDLGFFRFFHDLPSSVWLAEVGQLGSVGPSLRALYGLPDLALFADTLLLGIILWRFPPPSGPWRWRLSVAVAGLLLSLALLRVPPPRPGRAPILGTAMQTAQADGLLGYHARDLAQVARRPWKRWRQPPHLPAILARGRASVDSVAKASPYFGLARGHNVLIVLLESWQGFTLDMEVEGMKVMPSLSAYRDGCLYFPNYYDQTNQAGSADGEFLMNLSLLPAARGAAVFSYANDTFAGLPHLLSDQGYHTSYAGYYDSAFWNARRMTASYGYQKSFFAPFGAAPEAADKIGWSLADYPLLSRALPLVTEQKPFFAMVKCSMGHHPWEELEDEQQFLKLNARMDGAILGDYLQMCRFRDTGLSRFLYEFDHSPLAQNTILILTGDHAAPLSIKELEPLLPQDETVRPLAYAALQKMPMLVRLPGGQHGTVEASLGQLDFAPTLCHLLGVVPREPVFLGRNAFEGSTTVAMRRLHCATDGKLMASLSEPTAVALATLRPVPYEQARDLVREAQAQVTASDEVLEHDLVPWLVKQGAKR